MRSSPVVVPLQLDDEQPLKKTFKVVDAPATFSHQRRSSSSTMPNAHASAVHMACSCSAHRLRSWLSGPAWQTLHAVAAVIAVWSVDACCLLHVPDTGAPLKGLDAALCIVLAIFVVDWLARVTLGVAHDDGPAQEASQTSTYLRSAACVTDVVSAVSVLADLSPLRFNMGNILLRACRAIRLVRFSRHLKPLVRCTNSALTALAAYWLDSPVTDNTSLAAPSAIAAALCEEVAHKLAVLLIAGYIAATPLLTYVETNVGAVAWHAALAAEIERAPLSAGADVVTSLHHLSVACASAFAGSKSTPLRIEAPSANFTWVNTATGIAPLSTTAAATPVRTDDWLTLSSSGVVLRMDVRAGTAYVARANVLIGCALVGTMILVSAAMTYSTHVHVVGPLRRIFELIQASASAALSALFADSMPGEVLSSRGAGHGGDDSSPPMQGVETAVVRLATLVGHMSGVSTAVDHVEDADVDEHTRVWLQSQAATAADPNKSPAMRSGGGVHASSGMHVPLPRPRDPSMTVLPAGIVAQAMTMARRHGGVSDLGTPAVEEAASVPQALIDSWDFDTLALSSEQLRASVIKMFDATGLFEAKLVTKHHLAAFLIAIEARYSRIASYHTFAHAVDVTHTLYRLLALSDKRLRVAIADKFALLVAALAHDLGHPGVSNAYLVATRHALTLTHGDSSTLERFHIASLYELCAQDPEADVFASCDDATWRAVRRTIIGCILHTDMVHHGPLLSRGELCVQLHQEAGGGGSGGQDAASASSGKRSESAMLPSAAMALPPASEQSITAAAGHGHAGSSPDVVPFASPDERMLLFSLLLHAADISNPAKPWLIASKWADCVNTEFWAQGDAERGMGLPVAPLNDRHAVTSVSAGQINFMEFVVAPLFAFLAKAVPETKGLLEQLLHNRDVLGRAYEDEAAAAAAAGNTDVGAWDVSRMRNRQRAFREKYEPIAGLITHGRVSDRSDASTARRGHSNSPTGSIVGDMPAAEAMAARLRAALHASNNRVAPRGGHRPPLSSSRRGSGMSSRSGSIGSSLGGDVGHLQAEVSGPSTSAGQWIHRGSGAVRHLLSEVSVLAVPGGRDVNDGSALRSGSPDSVGMSQDMALSKPPRRGMFSGGSPPAPDGAVRHEDVAASRSVPSGRLTTRHNSYTEGDDVESGAGQPRQSSASRRGSFPPSSPVVL